jgi:hypothetical protein
LRFILTPITRADAKAISRWRYGGQYSVYDEADLTLPPDRGDLEPQGHQGLREGRFRAGRGVRRQQTERGERMPADEARGVIPLYTPRK